MKKFYRTFLTAVLALIATVANADASMIYSWDGNGATSEEAATIVGGTAVAKGGDANTVAGAKQKNNWCFKLGKSYSVENVPTHYVEITLNEALKGGEDILVNVFMTSEGKSAVLGIDFDGNGQIEADVTEVLAANGAPTTDVKLTAPAEAAGCNKVRIYRKTGNTTVYVSKLVITSSGDAPTPAPGASFTISDNGDGSVFVAPNPEDASWVAFAYPENGRASFLMNFGIDESTSDVEVAGTLMNYGLCERQQGFGKFSISEFMEMFGGAEAGNYVVAVAELNADYETIGEGASAVISFVPVDEEIEMNYFEAEEYKSDVDMIFQSEEWYARFDVKEVPIVPGKTYTIDDLDLDYSYMKLKDAEYAQNWTKLTYESVNLTIKENGNMDALVTVKTAEGETLTISMYYETNDQKSITVSGEYEVIDGVVAVTARNIPGDYKILLNIKASDLQDFGKYVISDLTAVGNSIQTPWDKSEEKIVDCYLYAMSVDDVYQIMGFVTGEYLDGEETKTRTYNVNLKLTKKQAQEIVVDFGNILNISEDEGDIKFKAENAEHQFIGYISSSNTDVPSGTYDLLSYSKYGDYNESLGIYMYDAVEDGKLTVVNENGTISITATFKQNGNSYTVNASCATSCINSVNIDAVNTVSKYIENGKIVILNNGKKYNVNAVEVK